LFKSIKRSVISNKRFTSLSGTRPIFPKPDFAICLVIFAAISNLWLRLGYQFYDIGGLALAPRQLDSFGHGGNAALDGFSLGLQATW
jgi:hypothetical protein